MHPEGRAQYVQRQREPWIPVIAGMLASIAIFVVGLLSVQHDVELALLPTDRAALGAQPSAGVRNPLSVVVWEVRCRRSAILADHGWQAQPGDMETCRDPRARIRAYAAFDDEHRQLLKYAAAAFITLLVTIPLLSRRRRAPHLYGDARWGTFLDLVKAGLIPGYRPWPVRLTNWLRHLSGFSEVAYREPAAAVLDPDDEEKPRA